VRQERVEEFVAAHVARVEAGEAAHPELIVIDPPRTGAARGARGDRAARAAGAGLRLVRPGYARA
jgi:hypothetical protein